MTLRTWVFSFALLTLVGCGKDIGDACKSINECISTDIDRLCLTQDGEGFPGGYCTKFNCGGSNQCPEEATCVAYRSTLDGSGMCESSRLQRNYCMLRCDSDGDCRSGYKCLPADGNNPLGARIIDKHAGGKICTLSYDEPSKLPERESEVCEPDGLLVRDAGASQGTDARDTSTDASVASDASVISPDVDASASQSTGSATSGQLDSETLATSEEPSSVETSSARTSSGVRSSSTAEGTSSNETTEGLDSTVTNAAGLDAAVLDTAVLDASN
jgi:hypothetical protein